MHPIALLTMVFLAGCSQVGPTEATDNSPPANVSIAELTLTSPELTEGGTLPAARQSRINRS